MESSVGARVSTASLVKIHEETKRFEEISRGSARGDPTSGTQPSCGHRLHSVRLPK